MADSDTQPPEEERPEEERPEEESSTLGRALRVAREERELSIEQIAGELRVESRVLIALEEDDYEEFSAPVFTKGYIKLYGQRLGLDYGDLLASYYRNVDVRDVPVVARKPIQLRDEHQITRWIIAGAVLALLIFGFTVWYLSQADDPPLIESPASAVPVEPAVPEAVAVGVPDPVAAAPDPVAIPLPEEPIEPEVVDLQEPEPEALVVVSAASGPASEPIPPPRPTVEVSISFEQDCWTEVTDARGERVFYGLGSAGATSRFDAVLPLSFFLGNAAGVRLLLNGRPYPIPGDSRQGNLARFVIAEGL